MFDNKELNNKPYNDCYFSYNDGLNEALAIFVEGNSLPSRIGSELFTVAETGFGTGLNLLALVKALSHSHQAPWKIRFISVEKYPLSTSRITQLVAPFQESLGAIATQYLSQWEPFYQDLSSSWNTLLLTFDGGSVELQLFVGDVEDFFGELTHNADAWFLDGHSPDKNPDMWNDTVFAGVGAHCHSSTTFATFTSAGFVRRGLEKNGFRVERKEGFGGKRHMMVGVRGVPAIKAIKKSTPRHLRDFTPKSR